MKEMSKCQRLTLRHNTNIMFLGFQLKLLLFISDLFFIIIKKVVLVCDILSCFPYPKPNFISRYTHYTFCIILLSTYFFKLQLEWNDAW